MNDINARHHPHGDPNGGSNHAGGRPYWKRAHRDWRLWACMIVMLAALMIYLTIYELGGRSPNQPRQPIAVPSGN